MLLPPKAARLYGIVRMSSLVGLVASLLLLFACHTRAASVPAAASIIVKVVPDQLDQVAASITQQGFSILQQNTKFGFLVVSQHATPAAASATLVSGVHANTPGWKRHPPNTHAHSGGATTASSNSTAADAAWYRQLGLSKQPVGAPAAVAASSQQLPSYSRSTAAAAAAAAAAAFVGSTDAAAVTQQLAELPGVQTVEHNRYMWLLDRPAPRILQQHAQQEEEQQEGRSPAAYHDASAAATVAAANDADRNATVCSAFISYNPDLQTGRGAEGSPYGITLVEADTEDMIAISREYRNKIMWCVVDTGLDRSNSEFDPNTTSGCIPGAVRSDGSPHACQFNWFDDLDGHGTHTSGSIGARRDGQGIVGVAAEGAHIYHYNIFGPNEYFNLTDAVTAWDDCINELDARKAATATPDMKLVISMSFGGNQSASIMVAALDAVLQERSDVLFVAAAGNSGTNEMTYPAGYPQVVSVGAVAWDGEIADFSTYNNDVEWAAPGLGVLSTVPLWRVADTTNWYNTFVTMTVTSSYEFATPDMFTKPPLVLMEGSARGTMTGELVDCGAASSACTGAAGRVCLIEETHVRYCTQMLNCLEGGGTAAVFFGGAGRRSCEMMFGALQCSASYKPPASGWPIAIAAALVQGRALQAALYNNVSVTVTIETGSGRVALETLSGTSMATPIAAGVAGLLWSAHASCTAEDIRAAIAKTTKDMGPPGRDQYYGYGIVKALAAHHQLLANPCTPPAPPEPVDCAGAWEWNECSQECGGGTQDARYVINIAAKHGGKPCEARDGDVQSRNCNTQLCGRAVDDEVTVFSGQWTAIDVFVNDPGSFLNVSLSAGPREGVAKMAPMEAPGADLGTLLYKSTAGYVGADRFKYTVHDSGGQASTALVTVTVVAGSCQGNGCSPGGVCYTSIGRCQCSRSSGMTPTFINNPSVASRDVTPQVPACRYPAMIFPPIPFTVVEARRRSKVYMPFGLGSSKYCADGDVVTTIGFEKQPACSRQKVRSASLPAAAGVQVGQLSCKQGRYNYVFKAPGTTGCYTMTVQLRDRSSHSVLFKAV